MEKKKIAEKIERKKWKRSKNRGKKTKKKKRSEKSENFIKKTENNEKKSKKKQKSRKILRKSKKIDILMFAAARHHGWSWLVLTFVAFVIKKRKNKRYVYKGLKQIRKQIVFFFAKTKRHFF